MARLLALTLVALAPGCGGIRYYAQPSESQPHASVVIRFDHSARSDTGPLDELIWIDGDPIQLRVDDDHALRVRVVPGPTQWVFKTMRYHEDEYVMRVHHGAYGSSHAHTTYTPVVDHVGEAGCTARWSESMSPRDEYFFEYRYVSPEECSVTCTHGPAHAPCDGRVEAPPRP